jgi:hypothetical protein
MAKLSGVKSYTAIPFAGNAWAHFSGGLGPLYAFWDNNS